MSNRLRCFAVGACEFVYGVKVDVVIFSWTSSCPYFGGLSAPKSQRFLRFAIAMPIADPRNRSDLRNKTKQCCIAIIRVRWKVASDLRSRTAISEPKTPSFCRFCGISGDLAPSTRKSLAIAILQFWCAKVGGSSWVRLLQGFPFLFL